MSEPQITVRCEVSIYGNEVCAVESRFPRESLKTDEGASDALLVFSKFVEQMSQDKAKASQTFAKVIKRVRSKKTDDPDTE